MTTRDQMVTEVRSWIGTPWRHQQSAKGFAADCYGMLLGAAIAVGIARAQEIKDDPAFRGYGHRPISSVMGGALAKYMDRIQLHKVLPADVLWMRFDAEPRHLALVSSIDPLRIIHAYAQARMVTESAPNVWGAVIVSAWRFREFA